MALGGTGLSRFMTCTSYYLLTAAEISRLHMQEFKISSTMIQVH